VLAVGVGVVHLVTEIFYQNDHISAVHQFTADTLFEGTARDMQLDESGCSFGISSDTQDI